MHTSTTPRRDTAGPGGPPPGGPTGSPPGGFGAPPGGPAGSPPGGFGGPPGGGFGGPPGGFGGPPQGGYQGPPGFSHFGQPPPAKSSNVGLIVALVVIPIVLLMLVGGAVAFFVVQTAPSPVAEAPYVPPPRTKMKARKHDATDEPTPRRTFPNAPAADPVDVDIPKDAPFKGAANAAIVIVEFSDFQCPFCTRVNPTLKRILADHNDVKVVWRHHPLPFHKNAPLAHEASVEAFVQEGNGGFWRMHDLLFANQRQLDKENLIALGEQAGLDTTKLRAALDDRRHRARVQADSDAARSVGLQGTPSFLINGRPLKGAQPYGRFDTIIKQARAAAR